MSEPRRSIWSRRGSRVVMPHRRIGVAGVGRALRALAGTDESLLTRVPSEHARQTAMGGVVLGTATLAALSVSVALVAVFDGFDPAMLIVVPVWALFVLNLDRWLMSTSVAPGRRRFGVFLPRLVLAVAFGVVIAEPLLLAVFHTAIEEEVKTERSTALVNYQSRLRACNPVSGVVVKEPACASLRLVIRGGTPSAKAAELRAVTAQHDAIQRKVDSDVKQYQQLEDHATNECAGTAGPGLTGVQGDGPECLRLRKDADDFKASRHIDANNRKLAALTDRISALNSKYSTVSERYAVAVNDAIVAKVTERRAAQKEIGLLERFRGLGELVRGGGYVLAAEWALRSFLILVDALPVIVKFISGRTPYDELLADRVGRQVAMQKRRHSREQQRHADEEETERQRATELERLRRLEIVAERESAVDDRAIYLLDEAWGGWWRPPSEREESVP